MSHETRDHERNSPYGESIRVVGRRVPQVDGIQSAEAFLDMVIALRGAKPFIPKGVHRFSRFEESQAWSIRMMGRRRRDA